MLIFEKKGKLRGQEVKECQGRPQRLVLNMGLRAYGNRPKPHLSCVTVVPAISFDNYSNFRVVTPILHHYNTLTGELLSS